MIIIKQDDETTFLNDKAIVACSFNQKTGKVSVLTPSSSFSYSDVVNVSYITDGKQDGVVECEVNYED